MVEVRYVPATGAEQWRVALAPAAAVALPANVSIPTVEAVWRRLEERGIGAVIEALTGAFGTSLAAIPDFILAIVEGDGLRVAVRGPVELVVETESGPLSVSGQGVSTWVERHIPGVQRASALFADAADEAASLPFVEGVVAADSVTVDLTGARPGVRPASPFVAAPTTPAVPAPESPAPSSVEPPTAAAPASPAPAAPAEDESEFPFDESPGAQTFVPLSDTAAADEHAMIWGETVVRPTLSVEQPEAAASASPADDATVVSSPLAPAGDHDGETIAVADIRSARRTEPAVYESTEIVPARRLTRGRIRVSDGQVVELDNTVIIGRRPRSPRSTGDMLPTLVAVESPEQDISRNHVEIRAEGEHVLVVDLDTTNGSVLLRGGNDPVRLHPSEPTMVVSGDVLDIGDGVTIAFEDLP
ncbi:FHA domain-containing protein [Microbacterium sp. H37-C3]|uniref:FHA domain-containing protein n=1 Tax=Microbacterium sp. H37-C3 TaxID=3004354 RepID=UPI0022AE6D95|nr:FHA domain-containing protein [Microbacterium sp. H37-C3]MCZ4067204.1 FHA domain-containing protein [Microbacterium sp. H37-C3]